MPGYTLLVLCVLGVIFCEISGDLNVSVHYNEIAGFPRLEPGWSPNFYGIV